MKPRVTLSLTEDGALEFWLNEEGRDMLVRELQKLSEKNDLFHLVAEEWGGAEINLSLKPYRDTDKVLGVGKVLLRPDEWDCAHFPHVMADDR